MKDYNVIVKQVTEAVEQIKDQKIKETAFARLLEDALSPSTSSSPSASLSPLSTSPSPSPSVTEHRKVKITSKSNFTRAPYNINGVRQEVKDVFQEVHAKQSGVKAYNSLKQNMHKYLWVLEVARQNGIDSLTNSEIAYVLDTCFREGISDRSVTNLITYTRNGYVQRRELNGITAWRILNDGINVVTDKVSEETTN